MGEQLLDDEFKAAFLELLCEIPVLTQASRVLGVHHSTVRKARKRDKSFDEAVKSALDIGNGGAEAEAYRRAVVGYNEPVFYKGTICGTVKKYSDQLLRQILAGNNKKYSKFGDGENVGEVIFNFVVGGKKVSPTQAADKAVEE